MNFDKNWKGKTRFQIERKKRLERAERTANWRPQRVRRKCNAIREFEKICQNIGLENQVIKNDFEKCFDNFQKRRWIKGKGRTIEDVSLTIVYRILLYYHRFWTSEYAKKIKESSSQVVPITIEDLENNRVNEEKWRKYIVSLEEFENDMNINSLSENIYYFNSRIKRLEEVYHDKIEKIKKNILFFDRKNVQEIQRNSLNKILYKDLEKIDPMIGRFRDNGFDKLFRCSKPFVKVDEKVLQTIRENHAKSIIILSLGKFRYLITKLDEKELKKKRKGLFAAFCYMISWATYLDTGIKPAAKDRWCKFFKLDKKTFIRRVREIKLLLDTVSVS